VKANKIGNSYQRKIIKTPRDKKNRFLYKPPSTDQFLNPNQFHNKELNDSLPIAAKEILPQISAQTNFTPFSLLNFWQFEAVIIEFVHVDSSVVFLSYLEPKIKVMFEFQQKIHSLDFSLIIKMLVAETK
jgi:hypothetical protein